MVLFMRGLESQKETPPCVVKAKVGLKWGSKDGQLQGGYCGMVEIYKISLKTGRWNVSYSGLILWTTM